MTTKKKKIIGLVMLVYPLPLLLFVLSAYSIFSFITSAVIGQGSNIELMLKIVKAVNILLSLLGVMSIIGFFVCMPLGIVLYIMARKQEKAHVSNHKLDE